MRRGRSRPACCEVISVLVEASTLSALRSSRMLAVGTGVRIVLAPAVMALLLSRSFTTAAVLFLVAATTDYFDGRLARRWGVTTLLGSFLDTTADKLLVTTALIGLVAVDRASPWIALIIVARELTILGLRGAVASGGRHLETSMLGKCKATVQFVAIALAMLRPDAVIAGAFLDQWVMIIAAIVTGWSGIDYLLRSSSAPRP